MPIPRRLLLNKEKWLNVTRFFVMTIIFCPILSSYGGNDVSTWCNCIDFEDYKAGMHRELVFIDF